MEEKLEYTVTVARAKGGRCRERVPKCYYGGMEEEGQDDLSVGEGEGENPEWHCLVGPSAAIEMFSTLCHQYRSPCPQRARGYLGRGWCN